MAADPPTPGRAAWRTTWRVLAIVVVAGLVLAGLATAGYLVLLMVALGSFGSNK
jgi:hypothetical protein